MSCHTKPLSPVVTLTTAGDPNFSLNGPSIVVFGVGGGEYCACKSLNSDGTYALVKDRQHLSVGTRQSDGAYAWQILAKNGTTRAKSLQGDKAITIKFARRMHPKNSRFHLMPHRSVSSNS
jgi:hypothetical protein